MKDKSPTAWFQRISSAKPDDWKSFDKLVVAFGKNPGLVNEVVHAADGFPILADLICDVLVSSSSVEKKKAYAGLLLGHICVGHGDDVDTLNNGPRGQEIRKELV